MVEISERLKRALSEHTYDSTTVQALGKAVREGGLRWFVEEFEAALRAHALTPENWNNLASDDRGYEEEDWPFLDDELRGIWHQVAPDRPYPYDEPDTAPPPGWVDHLNEDGIGGRLADALVRHLRDARGDVRPEPGRLRTELFRNMVEFGNWSWLPPALEAALQSGNLTNQTWGKLVYGNPHPDPEAAEEDKRRLWQAVAPDRPYPGNATTPER